MSAVTPSENSFTDINHSLQNAAQEDDHGAVSDDAVRRVVEGDFGTRVSSDYIPDRQIAQLRIPPHSIEAESSVLGGLLLDNGAWDRVGDLLNDSDFYRYEHRLIYSGMTTLINASKPADVITVYEHLQSLGKSEEVGGLVYLNSLAQYVPSASNIRRYAEIVRERPFAQTGQRHTIHHSPPPPLPLSSPPIPSSRNRFGETRV